MIKNSDYTFDVMLSRVGYKFKQHALNAIKGKNEQNDRVEKMAFFTQHLNAGQFKDYILNGYTYCNLFEAKQDFKYKFKTHTYTNYSYPYYKRGNNKGGLKISFKSDRFFAGTYIVSIDIDSTSFDSLNNYIDTLSYKPTIAYCSYSDKVYILNDKEQRKFRLVYIFNKKLSKDEFNTLSYSIHRQIEIDTDEEIKDKCGNKISQYFNGTNKTEHYISNYIYSVEDIMIYDRINSNEFITDEELDNILGYNNTEVHNNNSYNVELRNKIIKQEPQVILEGTTSNNQIEFDKELIKDIKRFGVNKIITKYKDKYNYFYRTEREDWIEDTKGKYQFTDDNYISLYFNTTKIKDGNARRKKLYSRTALRRIIKPSSSPDELLYNIAIDVLRFFDNSDGELTVETMMNNVADACYKSISRLQKEMKDIIEVCRKNKPKFIVYKEDKKLTKETVNKIVHTKYDIEKIKKYYNPNLSQRKNIELLKENGITISKTQLLRLITKYDLNNTQEPQVILEGTTSNNQYEDIDKVIETVRNNLYNGDESNLNDNIRPMYELLCKYNDNDTLLYIAEQFDSLLHPLYNYDYTPTQLKIVGDTAKRILNNKF